MTGAQSYGAIEYKGTWYTDDNTADQYFGFVFGYVSNRKFYVVMWKGRHYNYKSTYIGGIQGPQIKVSAYFTHKCHEVCDILALKSGRCFF